MKDQLLKRIILSFLGVIIISIAVAIFRFVNLGVDPFSCFNLGIANVLNISFGNSQVLVSVILIVALVWFGWRYFGIGTIFSMIMVGYVSDFILGTITIDPMTLSFMVRFLLLLVGLCVTSMGIALYSCANLGISPYDAVAFIIDDRSHGKLQFRYVRIVFDVLLVVFGFFMGGPVGIGTLVIAFGVGPIVSYLINHLIEPYIIKKN